MKVKDLIAELTKLNPNARVILLSDEEGNDFHDLGEVDGNKSKVYLIPLSWKYRALNGLSKLKEATHEVNYFNKEIYYNE